ncbi:MAG: carbohydrate kinase, partial [Cyanobacteriota bacterium]|nr:carbohydrate kinase [Cyanobacteriota bacterium]
MTGTNPVHSNEPEVICLGEALVDRLGPLGGDPAVDQPVENCLGGAPANVACG